MVCQRCRSPCLSPDAGRGREGYAAVERPSHRVPSQAHPHVYPREAFLPDLPVLLVTPAQAGTMAGWVPAGERVKELVSKRKPGAVRRRRGSRRALGAPHHDVRC